jgi:hypothetical protein
MVDGGYHKYCITFLNIKYAACEDNKKLELRIFMINKIKEVMALTAIGVMLRLEKKGGGSNNNSIIIVSHLCIGLALDCYLLLRINFKPIIILLEAPPSKIKLKIYFLFFRFAKIRVYNFDLKLTDENIKAFSSNDSECEYDLNNYYNRNRSLEKTRNRKKIDLQKNEFDPLKMRFLYQKTIKDIKWIATESSCEKFIIAEVLRAPYANVARKLLHDGKKVYTLDPERGNLVNEIVEINKNSSLFPKAIFEGK